MARKAGFALWFI
jgi:CRP-like cAMP-binding protein